LVFFAGDVSPAEISTVAPDALVGCAALINYRSKSSTQYELSYVYEAIMTPPNVLDPAGQRRQLLNNFICREAEFRRTIQKREFGVKGFYFCQQNTKTHVCAHASLRMAINSDSSPAAPISNVEINKQLKITPPFTGLQIGQIAEVIKNNTKCEPVVIDCSSTPKSGVLAIVAAYVQSGAIVLLVFSTQHATDHVVTVFGHTRNSDEWHPQAILGYSGPKTAQYYSNSSWIDHFIIHDDNLGPYYTLSSRALEVDPTIAASQIIAIHPFTATVRPLYAETLSAILLSSSLKNVIGLGSGNWFNYITQNNWIYVTRAILIGRVEYQNHLRSSIAHDESKLTEADIALFDCLPDYFWMVEFSLPALFTGNRSKLGDVIVSAVDIGNNSMDRVKALRLPSLVVITDPAGPKHYRVSMTSHSPIFVNQPHDHLW